MSGTAYGTIVLHVAPEAAVGGPLALVRNGDRIRLSVKERRLDLLVDEAELAKRRQGCVKPAGQDASSCAATTSCSARPCCRRPDGCDFDFLRGSDPAGLTQQLDGRSSMPAPGREELRRCMAACDEPRRRSRARIPQRRRSSDLPGVRRRCAASTDMPRSAPTACSATTYHLVLFSERGHLSDGHALRTAVSLRGSIIAQQDGPTVPGPLRISADQGRRASRLRQSLHSSQSGGSGARAREPQDWLGGRAPASGHRAAPAWFRTDANPEMFGWRDGRGESTGIPSPRR